MPATYKKEENGQGTINMSWKNIEDGTHPMKSRCKAMRGFASSSCVKVEGSKIGTETEKSKRERRQKVG